MSKKSITAAPLNERLELLKAFPEVETWEMQQNGKYIAGNCRVSCYNSGSWVVNYLAANGTLSSTGLNKDLLEAKKEALAGWNTYLQQTYTRHVEQVAELRIRLDKAYQFSKILENERATLNRLLAANEK